MSDELRATFAEPQPDPDWSDREAAIEYLVENERPFASRRDFDEARRVPAPSVSTTAAPIPPPPRTTGRSAATGPSPAT